MTEPAHSGKEPRVDDQETLKDLEPREDDSTGVKGGKKPPEEANSGGLG